MSLGKFKIKIFDKVGSTNDEAKKLAQAGKPAGIVVVANEQEQGRGRLERKWISPPGNLYLSLVLRPECVAMEAAQLSFVTALAARDAIKAVSSLNVEFKWPNDLLVGGRKIGGILLESSYDNSGNIKWVIVGVGINIESFPDDVMFPATSMLEEKSKVKPKDLQAAFLDSFKARYAAWEEKGFEASREEWLASAAYKGKEITVKLSSSEISGVFRDIQRDGSLMLEEGNGNTLRLSVGDVFTKG